MFTNYSLFYSDIKTRGVEYAIEHTAKLGFDAVEFLALPEEKCNVSTAKKELSAASLKVSCYSVCANLLSGNTQKTETLLLKYADVAAELGSTYFHHTLVSPLVLPQNAPSFSEVLPIVVRSAEKIANHCEKLGITCLYEPQGMYVNGEGLKRFFEEMKKRCRNIGICGDVGNSLFVDYSPSLIFDELAPYIKHVHLKDYKIKNEKSSEGKAYRSLGGKWLYDAPLGSGDVDISHCLSKLREQNYCGDFAFEVEGSDEVMKKAVEYVKNMI